MLRMFQVDAFTDRVFGGNPAAVLRLEDWLPTSTMQSIAQENNLAETAFVKPAEGGDHWDLRWFTPTSEVEFCGHATLATAHVLRTEYGSPSTMDFETRVGLISVVHSDDGYQLDIPAFPPQDLTALPNGLDVLFESKPKGLFRNFENLFADLGTDVDVRAFVPDLSRIATLGKVGLVITGRGTTAISGTTPDFVSRYFVPGAGIPEDPVTGSTHATLVPYWADRLDRQELLAFQASARGGWLECQLVDTRVLLGGQAVTFMRADIVASNTTGFAQ